MSDLDNIINGGYCIGCGTCASISNGNIRIKENKFQQYRANIENNTFDISKALEVCPFSNSGPNEDEISQSVFDTEKGKIDNVIGFYQSLYAGHVNDKAIRGNSSSGGIITWILLDLIKNKEIDAVMHVQKSSISGKIFSYGISKTKEEIIAGAKSRYYPIEMSEVLNYVKDNDLKYAFVGLPCFNKSLRKYAEIDPIINKRIKFYIGFVCGHLKSKSFTDFLGFQAGLDPQKIIDIDFRHKVEGQKSDNYGIRITDKEGNQKTLMAKESQGTNWGLGYFKYEACDYCDDIFAETADLNIGDAWLNHYTADSEGNSIIITRNSIIDRIIKDGIREEELTCDKLSPEEIKKSQGGGFRHRRSALGYRLYLKKKNKQWAPKKRIPINKNGLSFTQKLIYTYRVFIMKKSSEYWSESRMNGNYKKFSQRMARISYMYSFLLKVSSFLKKIKQL